MLRQHFLKTKTTYFKQTEKGRKANAPHLGCVFFPFSIGCFNRRDRIEGTPFFIRRLIFKDNRVWQLF